MATLQNLAYRVERIFKGERGIVIDVDLAPLTDDNEKPIFYDRCYFGNKPQLVKFKNPLGELVSALTPKILTPANDPKLHDSTIVDTYKTYKPGDKFP